MIYVASRSNSDQLKINKHDQSTVDGQTITHTMITTTMINPQWTGRAVPLRLGSCSCVGGQGRGRRAGEERGGEGKATVCSFLLAHMTPRVRSTRPIPLGGAVQGESKGADEIPNRKPHNETTRGTSAIHIPTPIATPPISKGVGITHITKRPTKHPLIRQCAMTYALPLTQPITNE